MAEILQEVIEPIIADELPLSISMQGSDQPYISRYRRTIKRNPYRDYTRVFGVERALQALNFDESSPVPTPPFETIQLEQAVRDDPDNWLPAIKAELISLSRNGTWTIC